MRHMPPGVEHAMLGEDAAGGDKVVDQRGVDGAGGGNGSGHGCHPFLYILFEGGH